ncbi:hypothetical protein ACH9L7_04135 [Haloferax sp. S1W]
MERTSYVCRDCRTTVSASSYRATCPNCEGELRPGSATNRHLAGG